MSIECLSLSKSFKSKLLFEDLNLKFEKGICHCISGENGTGKTTLLKIMAGLEKSDTGTVIKTGSCTYSGSNPYMLHGTVLENIQYPFTLTRQSDPSSREKVMAMIKRLGLQGLEQRTATSLSSGEKQKVALGRALVWNPEILLLDEPTANIDSSAVGKIEEILLDYIKSPNHTLLLVSHDLEQAKRLSGKSWILKKSNEPGHPVLSAIST
ncbi:MULTISPECIES: ATP-binding cassette domain-containing protein [unclassified Fusibacter]|uniref:ABC transporter ATP-binding protein n=1 Tax=unclassified Fusibacter TaxID=2624464 RepID=UPI0010135DCC|nr:MULTISPECIES: ATP-binding cassette domain-containing protein [unclassified Fusibacter]MCK8061132.1 ATP-binding cassette domain-containing protein [Fusibacter sp. A2]NPE23332.1 ATP-binding cassette domain-containing protein [Fusibacter sp. A1]RXV59375.1 ATP-binding cassette domain-containing protein [Fusibacter sp. A1]